eukprot:CAMPEP_0202693094 /NCGR_PEP_ID=MMETSP1385-20130828/7305_1 /ASSEMBLY_ACC=CAM_ASM_000861 /TAXON_ID=933848 /ORGANISM="Elphidium margaritaceum" /LENGTH=414 /DNA_ID=CAMNT_0049348733 /DNA_START=59 /DNA_END=1303 /DNA_ORIENTATION=-
MLSSDLDAIDSQDPELLLSQLPLQSDVDDLPDISLLSESNLDVDATENDEMIIKLKKPNNHHHHHCLKDAHALQNHNNKKKLDLINDADDTVDTDIDDIGKPINNGDDAQAQNRRPWYYKPKNWLKLNLVFLLMALLISGLSQPKMLWNMLQIFLSWMEANIVAGSFVFISLYITFDLLMLPCIIFTFGSGFVYCNVLHSMMKGLFLSTSIVFVSELIGSTIAFLSARYLLRKTIKSIAAKYPKFTLIDAAVKKNGFRVTLLFRMSPVTPYNLFNYFMGLTSVRFMDYTLASIGILPNFFVWCFIGASMHHIYQLSQIDITSNIPLLVITLVGFLFIVFIIFYGTKFIRRELAKISIEMKQEKDILSSSDENLPLTENDIRDVNRDMLRYDQSNLDDCVSIDLVSNNDISNIDM